MTCEHGARRGGVFLSSRRSTSGSHGGSPQATVSRSPGGPFAGLVFPPAAVGAGPLPAKLVGAYECELHDVMEERIAARPSRVVNVGSAEGYYAIGFARRLPHAAVIAFDPDREAQRLTRLGARANGVASRLQQRGLATAGEISDLGPDADTLLFVDCEGAEDDLLDPDRLPCLRVTPIVVELHEHVVPGIGERLTGRFQATHELTRIWAAERASFHLDAPFASWPQRDSRRTPRRGAPAFDVLARDGAASGRLTPRQLTQRAASACCQLMTSPRISSSDRVACQPTAASIFVMSGRRRGMSSKPSS